MSEAEREQTRLKIWWVCGYIVRGRSATNSWTVRLYRLQLVLSVVLAVLAGGGVIVLQNGVIAHNGDLITVGGVLALSSGLFTGLYHAFDTEKKAVQALAAHDSFDAVYDSLEIAVKMEDPTTSVNAARTEAEAHLRSFRAVVTMKVAPPHAVQELYDGLLADVDTASWQR